MSDLQQSQIIPQRSLSADKILITLQNLAQITSQQYKSMRINNTTTIQEVKLKISNNLENNEHIELYFDKDQPFIGNLNDLVINKIKQANTRTIYYRIIKRNKSQPSKLNDNYQQPTFDKKVQEQKVQQNVKSIYSKNMICSTSSSLFNNLKLPNIQGNSIVHQQENQSLKDSLQQLKVKQTDLLKQNQELINENKLIRKQILKDSLKMQDLEQDNIILSQLNQQISNELARFKDNQSEFESLKVENQKIKDEINQIKLLSEQILMEKHKLQEHLQQLVIEQCKFNNLQQDKPNLLSQNQIQYINQLDQKQINVVNTFRNLAQQQNQQQNQKIEYLSPNLKKNVPSNLDSHNQNFINKCGHAFSVQQLEYIIFKAILNKWKALCNQCSQPLNQKLCLQNQSFCKTYLENQHESDLLNLKNGINLRINSNSQQIAKCKNQNCMFFCIWEKKYNKQQIKQKNSFCQICQEQSVINSFLPNQVQQEL